MGDFREFLVSDIMPAREVHLLGGPSGAGKTRLTLQGIPEFLSGGSFLGKSVVRPFQIFYFSCDRSPDSFRRNLDFYHLDEGAFPWGTPTNMTTVGLLGEIKRSFPDTSLVIVDGFTSLIPGGRINDYKVVADFLVETQKLLQRLDLTLLGIVHTAKIKESEMILNPRQKIAGSVAWAGYSDLIVMINPEDDRSPENQNRIVHVLPRNSAEYTLPMVMREGRLEPNDGELSTLSTLLGEDPIGTLYTTLQLRDLAGGTPHASFYRWLKAAIAEGTLVQERRGVYRKA